MSTPTFEDACRSCDAASAHGTNFVGSFGALATLCKGIGSEFVASKAKELLRIILCSAPMCSSSSRIKAVRSVAICVLESGPSAAALLATGLLKGSSIYAHKSEPRASPRLDHAIISLFPSFAGRALFLQLRSASCCLKHYNIIPSHISAAAASSPCPFRLQSLPNPEVLQPIRRLVCLPLSARRCTPRSTSHLQLAAAILAPALTCLQLATQQLKWAVDITRAGGGRMVPESSLHFTSSSRYIIESKNRPTYHMP